MKKLTRWIWIETEKGGLKYYSNTYSTKEKAQESYESFYDPHKAFGTPGSKVEYVKLTNDMELKDMGDILRSQAESWVELGAKALIENDTSGSYASAQRNHGKRLNELLDRCGVPQLEDET